MILQIEFMQNPNWTKDFIQTLAERLNLSRTKVYKWNWDRRNRARCENEPLGGMRDFSGEINNQYQ